MVFDVSPQALFAAAESHLHRGAPDPAPGLWHAISRRWNGSPTPPSASAARCCARALKPLGGEALLIAAGIDPSRRAETPVDRPNSSRSPTGSDAGSLAPAACARSHPPQPSPRGRGSLLFCLATSANMIAESAKMVMAKALWGGWRDGTPSPLWGRVGEGWPGHEVVLGRAGPRYFTKGLDKLEQAGAAVAAQAFGLDDRADRGKRRGRDRH